MDNNEKNLENLEKTAIWPTVNENDPVIETPDLENSFIDDNIAGQIFQEVEHENEILEAQQEAVEAAQDAVNDVISEPVEMTEEEKEIDRVIDDVIDNTESMTTEMLITPMQENEDDELLDDDLSDEALAAEGYVQKESRKERRARKKRERELAREQKYLPEDEITRSYDVLNSDAKAINFDDDDEEYEYVTPHYGLNAFMLTLLCMVIGAVSVFFIFRQSMKADIRQLYINQGYMQTRDSYATAADIAEGKTAYVNGKKIIGTHVDIDTSTATATANDILQGYSAYVNGQKVSGKIPTFPLSAYYIPSTEDIVIPKGYYVADDIIVQGDYNLAAKNIRKGITIFKVKGTYE
ncbi:MAG: hypothetical protein II161_04630 [Erysipelotrichaceae bacterium]|nr:hypothetical protein [Erysipelotrichaceae bacterium]